MGFAAHLRYHWMENIVYRTLEYIPLALLGIGLHDFFVIHIFTLAWGHYNHSNISIKRWIVGGVVGVFIGLIWTSSLLGINLVGDLGLLSIIIFTLLTGLAGAVLLGPIVKYVFKY